MDKINFFRIIKGWIDWTIKTSVLCVSIWSQLNKVKFVHRFLRYNCDPDDTMCVFMDKKFKKYWYKMSKCSLRCFLLLWGTLLIGSTRNWQPAHSSHNAAWPSEDHVFCTFQLVQDLLGKRSYKANNKARDLFTKITGCFLCERLEISYSDCLYRNKIKCISFFKSMTCRYSKSAELNLIFFIMKNILCYIIYKKCRQSTSCIILHKSLVQWSLK